MIELRLKAIAQADMLHGKYYIPLGQYLAWDVAAIDRESAWAVLQYRQTKPGLVVQGMEVFGETTDWQDVEISDD